MKGKRLLKTIRISNLLSYGPEGASLEFEPLNVLIGPNASGKSNLVSVLRLLAATPRDLSQFWQQDGGYDWLWKGADTGTGTIEATVDLPPVNVYYRLKVDDKFGLGVQIKDEVLKANEELLYSLNQKIIFGKDGQEVDVEVDRSQSVLSQIKDPRNYPLLDYLSRRFGGFRFFQDFDLSRGSAVRKPQAANLPSDFLLDDASNLGLILSDLTNKHPKVKRELVERLRLLYERVEDITVHVQGGTVQVFLHEQGLNHPVPASRLSDGTLLCLCLLTILLHPYPPPLICLEEPEIGLHPDAVHSLAELLIDAATRTQLIVTTHSDALVSALSEVPEAVVVCERGEGGTTLRRLEPDKLTEWLEEYKLGDLWRMGQIGGNRW